MTGHFKSVCRAERRLQKVSVERHASTSLQSRIAAVDASELVDMKVEICDNGERQEVRFLAGHRGWDRCHFDVDINQSGTWFRAEVTHVTATGGPIKTEGKFTARLSWQRGDGSKISTYTEIHMLHNLAQPVLSKYTQIRLGMLHKEYPHAALSVVLHSEEPFPNTVVREEQDQPAVAPLTADPPNEARENTLTSRRRSTRNAAQWTDRCVTSGW